MLWKFFSNTTDIIYHKSNKQYLLWKHFIACEINGLSFAQTSIQIEKCRTTCFNMRHKLYKAIQSLAISTILSGLVEIDAAYTSINLKGTKPDKMPRHSKKRGSKAAYSEISHHKICLITAIDEQDNMLFRIGGLGPESYEIYSKYKDCFNNVTRLVSDSKASIRLFAESLNCQIEQIPVLPNKKRYVTNNGKTISNVNQLHSEFSVLITKSMVYLLDIYNHI